MRILVVGAGSTGGYFGARLAQAGRDVTFLVRPARAARLRADGLQIMSPHGDLTIRPQLVTAGEIAGPFDAVLLTVKAFSLDAALDDLAPAVGDATMVMPVLNGMRHLDVLTARFGAGAVIGGVCKVAATLDADGRIRQLAKFQELTYGELGGAASERTDRLHAAMQGAGFAARLSRTIERDMWEKWIMLASVGAITCLMRGTVGQVASASGGAAFSLGLLAECAAVAAASGHGASDGFLEATRAALTSKESGQTTSMYRDLTNGLPVEADQIVGDLLARADALGVPAPLLRTAFTHLSVYQAARGQGARG